MSADRLPFPPIPELPPPDPVPIPRPSLEPSRFDSPGDRPELPTFPPGQRDFDDVQPRRRRRRRRDEDDYDDDRPRRGPRTPANSWGTASVGVKMIFGCGILITLSILGMQAAMFTLSPGDLVPQPGQRQGPMPPGIVGILMLGGCTGSIAGLIGFVGACMCCASPDRWAHRWALTSILMLVGVLLLFCVGFGLVGAIANAAKKGGGGAQDMAAIGFGAIFLMILLGAVMAITFVFWMLFHASVGRALGNSSLVHQSYWYIGLPFVQAVLMGVLVAIIAYLSSQGRELGAIGFTAFCAFQAIMALLGNVWYLWICWQTFRTMDLAGKRAA